MIIMMIMVIMVIIMIMWGRPAGHRQDARDPPAVQVDGAEGLSAVSRSRAHHGETRQRARDRCENSRAEGEIGRPYYSIL